MELFYNSIDVLFRFAPIAAATFAGWSAWEASKNAKIANSSLEIVKESLETSKLAFKEQVEQMKQEIEISKRALAQTREIADKQIQLMELEWRPYLSISDV